MNDNVNLPEGIEFLCGMVWDGAEEAPELGACCACGATEQVDTLLHINRRALVPKRGAWGCVVCGVEGGAVVVLCRRCREMGLPVRWGCRGYPKEDGRAPIEEFTEQLNHDLSKHHELFVDRN